MEQEQIEKLIDAAIGQMGYAYAPYSGFCVGAALLTIPAAISKTRRIRPVPVRSGQPFRKQSAKGSGHFQPSASPAGNREI